MHLIPQSPKHEPYRHLGYWLQPTLTDHWLVIGVNFIRRFKTEFEAKIYAQTLKAAAPQQGKAAATAPENTI